MYLNTEQPFRVMYRLYRLFVWWNVTAFEIVSNGQWRVDNTDIMAKFILHTYIDIVFNKMRQFSRNMHLKLCNWIFNMIMYISAYEIIKCETVRLLLISNHMMQDTFNNSRSKNLTVTFGDPGRI